MTSLFAMRAFLFAAELFAASSLVVVWAWSASRNGAASRKHLVWMVAFAALAVFPVLAFVLPSPFVFTLAAPVQPTPILLTPEVIAALQARPQPRPAFHLDAETIVYGVIALWLLGIAFLALRGLVAAWALHRLHRQSVRHPFGHIAIDGPRTQLRISTADEDCGPVTWGIVKPIVLLPADAAEWPNTRLRTVLLHELAHVRRHDWLVQTSALVLAALYWPNPLVWMAVRALRREAEMAADDAVLSRGVRPSTYAGELVKLASEFGARRAASLPLFMAAPSGLEARVQSVLAPQKPRSEVTVMDVFRIACLGMMATTAIAFTCPSLAQDAPPAPSVESAPLAAPAPAAQPAPAVSAAQADDADSGDGQDMTAVGPVDNGGEPMHVSGKAQISAAQSDEGANDDADDNTHTVIINGNKTILHGKRFEVRTGDRLTPAERARIHRAVAQARASLKDLKPTLERAMREARMQMKLARMSQQQMRVALAEAQRSIADAHIDATVAKALKDAHIDETVAKSLKDAHIDETVAAALANAQRALEQADRDGSDAVIIDRDHEAAPPAPPAPPAAQPAPPAPPAPEEH